MKKALKIVLIVLACFAGVIGLLWLWGAIAYSSPEYMNRCISTLWNPTGVKDYYKFPAREIKNGEPVFKFKQGADEELVRSAFTAVNYQSNGRDMPITDFDTFLKSNGTTSFIVIKDDAILYEKYFNGYQRDAICTSFSVAKSFDSTMIGLAIQDGYVKSVNEPISTYLPELDRDGLGSVTIRNLMMMSSGIHYAEAYMPWGDDALTYYYPDLRRIALTIYMDGRPGEYFWYNNYHPLLEGMIIERATHKHVAAYLEEKIWSRIGMEFPATWSLDSDKTGFEKMESGINARAIDFAKFGRLFLNKGNWEGVQVVPSEWVTEATVMGNDARAGDKRYYSKEQVFNSGKLYYKYHWWCFDRGNGDYDYTAAGNFGQHIYVCPSKNMVIARNGFSRGSVDFWPTLFYRAVARF